MLLLFGAGAAVVFGRRFGKGREKQAA